MSIALERIEASGFGRVMTCDSSRFESTAVKERKDAEEEDDWRSSLSTTTSSSIGRNSDDVSGRSSDAGGCDENEVQSTYKGGVDMMDSLEQVLPMRRGISSFYNGKSKSFTSLADASSASSIKDIAKPENAYTRRRRNLLAVNHVWDKNRNKRPISSSKSTLALAVAISSSESISSTSEDSTSTSSPRLPPLHPQTRISLNNNNSTPSSPPSRSRNFSNWRSLSLADVREYTTVMGYTRPDCSLIHDETISNKRT
ncbi:uncharacterized protein LOC111286397 [Durio zibethinus]|uniref:Uncharacterized protein LOC111286397 n=1 Tax=Durio zibethinus TaxID=66656 RepID=A0A6P5XV44_DURZI|nr:uncharacterized protein LOC111286397 [Durio zibethinus]